MEILNICLRYRGLSPSRATDILDQRPLQIKDHTTQVVGATSFPGFMEHIPNGSPQYTSLLNAKV